MILYNHKKEFVGVDYKDLKIFGLENLQQVLDTVNDFADLFVKTPGYIHNFQHIHWIDFILSADSIEQNRVIIRVGDRNFKANVSVETLYMVDAPAKPAYGVVLSNIRSLSKGDLEKAAEGTLELAPTTASAFASPEISVAEEESEAIEEEFSLDTLASESENEELKDEGLHIPGIESESSITIPELHEEHEEEEITLEAPEESVEEVVVEVDEDDPFADYHYDPHVASEELGLPIDLIEEFIDDFIAQAKEFKPQLYNAFEDGDMTTVREMSHKLKGVAANLRIEDAFDALVKVNTSEDLDEVKHSLDKFYNVILKKLSGEEVKTVKKTSQPTAVAPQVPSSTPSQTDSDDEKIDLVLDDPMQEEIASVSTNADEPLELTLDTPQGDDDAPLDISLDDEPLTLQESEPVQSDSEDDEKIDLVLDDPMQEEIASVSTNADEPLELTLDTPKEDDDAPLDISLDDEPLSIQEEETIQNDSSEELPSIEPLESADSNAAALQIDVAHAASEMGIDTHVYHELLQDFVDDAQDIFTAMRESALTNDEVTLKKLAIRLKGMSENMFIPEVPELCEQLISTQSENKNALIDTLAQKVNSLNGMV